MNDTSKTDRKRELENSIEHEPQSKHGKQGQARHDHDVAGPNSDAYGETITPQKGDLDESDRAQG